MSSYTSEENKELLKDKFLMNQCTTMTTLLLERGLPINKVFEVVKDYQKKYIHLRKQSTEIAGQFTYIMWWKCQSWYKEI